MNQLFLDRLLDLSRVPVFAAKRTPLDGGVRATLLRLLSEGEKPAKTDPDLANIMRKISTDKIGRQPGKREHGCLIGLAKSWPECHQLAIFKTVLNDLGAPSSAKPKQDRREAPRIAPEPGIGSCQDSSCAR